MAGKTLQAAAALRAVTRDSAMASDSESDIYSDTGPLSPEMGSWSPVQGITESLSESEEAERRFDLSRQKRSIVNHKEALAGRTPLREWQETGPSRLSLPGGNGKSVYRDDNAPRKKKRVCREEQENFIEDTEVAVTNSLLRSLIKRMDRQDKQLMEMQRKIDETRSSSSCASTPGRAASRRKEVPLEVRVNLYLCDFGDNYDCSYLIRRKQGAVIAFFVRI